MRLYLASDRPRKSWSQDQTVSRISIFDVLEYSGFWDSKFKDFHAFIYLSFFLKTNANETRF